ncbi:MAG TPA: DUF1800 domain-containing protein [Pyrinomonadaceae bacterium]|jgi:Uncharacterized protein conserved in bacteria|nr:DUF1800 domain-containing protein [Pyrinomonadaceae bacterium]
MKTLMQMAGFQLKRARPVVSLFVIAVVLGSMFSQTIVSLAGGTGAAKPKKLTEEQRIIHVLNRLGFGARPGDVERVKAIGVENYINQQLNPDKIADTVAENKVKDLSSLSMSTAELYEKYPQPGQLLRQLQAKGAIPADLEQARENRVKGGANAKATDTPAVEMPAVDSQKANQPATPPAGNPLDNEKYRAAIQQYYRENGLQQPQRIVAELQASRILRAVYSERQLQEVMVDFWTNHFNVFAGKGADRWLLPSYDRDTIRPNAMAKFSTLLEATAKSPAMLFYLDNFQSVTPNPQRNPGAGQRQPNPFRDLINLQRRPGIDLRQEQRIALRQAQRIDLRQAQQPRPQPPQQQQRRGINENYARELMELHTLGVDGGYTQKDVQEVARCFTGWTIFQPRGGAAAANALMGSDPARRNAGTFFFNARAHDDGEKIVLGHKIPAGGGVNDGLMVLDILAHHPSTAKFIATKLTRHFVSDNPSPALVERVAATFTKTDGDIRETLRAIFMSPEFNSTEAYRAKIKRPFELVVSAIRTLGADTNGGPGTHQWIARMGEPLYGFQTPNGYSDSAESWVNTGGLLERMNFGLALASNRVQGTKVNLSTITGVVNRADINKNKMMDESLKTILGGDVSPTTRDALLKQLDQEVVVSLPAPRGQEPRDTSGPGQMSRRPENQMDGPVDQGAGGFQVGPQQQQRPRAEASISDPVTKVVGLILGTPEFQRQ